MTTRRQHVLVSSFRVGAVALVVAIAAYAVIGGGPARANEPVAGGLQQGSSISVNEPWQYQDTSGNGSAFKWWSQWKVCCWDCGTCTTPCTCGVQYTITFQVKYWIAGNPSQYTMGTEHTDTGQVCTLTNGCAVVTGQAPHTDSLTGTGYGGGSVTVTSSQADCICCCPEGVTIINGTSCSGEPVTFPFTSTGDGGTDGKVKKEPVE